MTLHGVGWLNRLRCETVQLQTMAPDLPRINGSDYNDEYCAIL